jgi:RNA polymerase sigma-70 factor (ECF subfamily)
MSLHPLQKANDLEMVKKIAGREPEAFAAFYDFHAPKVFAFLCRLLGNTHDAEEALQETFWQVWRQAGGYDSTRGTLMAWLIQIAKTRGLDRLRQIRKSDRRDGGPIEDLRDRLAVEKPTEDEVLTQETRHVVRKALGDLPLEQREAVTLAFFDGLTHIEISKQLKEPLGTIKTRIRLGMKKLQETLQEVQ